MGSSPTRITARPSTATAAMATTARSLRPDSTSPVTASGSLADAQLDPEQLRHADRHDGGAERRSLQQDGEVILDVLHAYEMPDEDERLRVHVSPSTAAQVVDHGRVRNDDARGSCAGRSSPARDLSFANRGGRDAEPLRRSLRESYALQIRPLDAFELRRFERGRTGGCRRTASACERDR